ncbi:uncharacterized protein N7500_000316 [Penicillium coprophilum]|uniref:uncharacterized protein n=1 Tax=Penicillium coprophilum TaxID=36646 RepID=UPI0023A1577D|nr:uncharacterized protein N7500_000316 [Penicillium coprophilum]KAJ5177617.1 hypothetical protein N7500_000316 [Penicillium coprophilum]
MDEGNGECDHSAFVTLVGAYWYQNQMTVDDEEMEQYSAVHEAEAYNAVNGCTEWDVGCTRVHNKVHLRGYVMINDMLDWQLHYRRVPEMGLFY